MDNGGHGAVNDDDNDPNLDRLDEDPDIPFDLGPTNIDDLKLSADFIKALRDATLADSSLSEAQLHRLRNPSHEVVSITDPVLGRSLQTWLELDHASNAVYEGVRRAMANWPPFPELLSLEQVQKKAQELTGIIPMYSDMCNNSCMAYTGPYAELDRCPTCGDERHDANGTPKKRMVTIPVGPQIQAAWRSADSAEAMKYRARYTGDTGEYRC